MANFTTFLDDREEYHNMTAKAFQSIGIEINHKEGDEIRNMKTQLSEANSIIENNYFFCK